MRVNVSPEGKVTITGRVSGRSCTLLTVLVPPVSTREASRLERLCNRGTRQPDGQGTLTWSITDFVETHFTRGDGDPSKVRVLRGETIMRLMNNRAPVELGDFGPILYERAEKRLRAEGQLAATIDGYAGLEAIFRDAVTRELPTYLATWRRTRALSEIDHAFIRLTAGSITLQETDEEDGSTTAVPSDAAIVVPSAALRPAGDLVQLSLSFEPGDVVQRLTARVRAIGGVCNEPLTHAKFAPREPKESPAKPSRGAKKRLAESGRRNGYYRSFTGDLRPIPLLNPHTVVGLAKAEGSLDHKRKLSKDDYLKIARAASDHRCKSGVGGGVIVPESAELYVRIFRALELTIEDVEALSPDDLTKVVRMAAELHKLAAPDDVVVH
jgi:hypothetical protein